MIYTRCSFFELLLGPAVKVNILMNKWIENFILIVSSILIMAFFSMGMFVSVIAEWSMNR